MSEDVMEGFTPLDRLVRWQAQDRAAPPTRLVRQRDIARYLQVSDSVVDQWRVRSAKTRFPEPVACQLAPPKGGGHRGAFLWDLEAVRRWHEWFRLPRNVRQHTPVPE